MSATASLLERVAQFETRPARWRIGLIALATDHTTERDFAALCPDEALAIYVNRVAFENPGTRENLMAMRPLLTAAVDLILPGEPLDAVAYGCTAASALIGDAAVRDAIREAKPDVPVVTPTSAALDAFRALAVSKVSLLTPYSQAVTDALIRYFEDNGLTIVNAACLGLADDREIAQVRPESILNAAVEACDPESEGLFISCTALRAVAVAQAIEDCLGLPVITSNQAMFWRTIRLAGCALPIAGAGRIVQAH